MIAIPKTRVLIGLTDDEAERLARELAKADGDAHAAIERRRTWLAVAMPAQAEPAVVLESLA